MKGVLRIAAALVIVAAAVLVIRAVPYERHRCRQAAFRIDLRTEQLEQTSNPMLIMSGTRENLAELAPCLASTPWNVQLHMLAGMNHSLRQDYEAAAAAYARALDYDRRPEIEHALGLALLNAGKRDEAMPHLRIAASVHRQYVRRLPDDVKRALYAELNKRAMEDAAIAATEPE